MELGAVHDASPSPPPKVVDIGLGLEGMTAIGRRGGQLGPSMVVAVGQESKPYACSTPVRPCAIYTRAGERGRTESGCFPGQKSVGRETFHSCPPAMGRTRRLYRFSFPGPDNAAPKERQRRDVPCASHGRELRRIRSRCDRSRLSSRSCSRTDTHLGIAAPRRYKYAPPLKPPHSGAAEGPVHGYSQLAVPIPHRPSQTRPYAVAGFPFVRRFPAAARPSSPGSVPDEPWHGVGTMSARARHQRAWGPAHRRRSHRPGFGPGAP